MLGGDPDLFCQWDRGIVGNDSKSESKFVSKGVLCITKMTEDYLHG